MWTGLIEALKTCHLFMENKRFRTIFMRKKEGIVTKWEMCGGDGNSINITDDMKVSFKRIYGPLPNSENLVQSPQRDPTYLSNLQLSPGHLQLMLIHYPKPDEFIRVMNYSPNRFVITFMSCATIHMNSNHVANILRALCKIHEATTGELRDKMIDGIKPHYAKFILHKINGLYVDYQLNETAFHHLQKCLPFWDHDMVKTIFQSEASDDIFQ